EFERLAATDEKFPVTCGIFGIERIFEAIIRGESAETALGAFVHGIAFNVHNFVQRPKKLYVSGGMCENRCFMESLARYCEIIPLGRYVLLEGLA
ncbi:MAG: ATPase, partial [Armatimonadetes bacterium]|nr:ATPase [Armatimonadota bacterium]